MDAEDAAKPGRRLQNKADKLCRIRAAAQALFAERGYDEATLRDIAARAGVGFGTLFAYAHDKRDLLFLLFAEDIGRLSTEPFATLEAKAPLIDQLLHVFAGNYELFARQPPLSRILLREITFDLFSPAQRTHLPDRSLIIDGLEALIARVQADGRIDRQAAPALIAATLYSTFSGAVRQWLRDDRPEAAAGIATLRAMLVLQITGLRPSAGEA